MQGVDVTSCDVGVGYEASLQATVIFLLSVF